MVKSASDTEIERIKNVASLLYRAARPLHILRSTDWPPAVREGFFANGARELPKVSYGGFDPAPTIEMVRERAVSRHFGEEAPRVKIVDKLSANAFARLGGRSSLHHAHPGGACGVCGNHERHHGARSPATPGGPRVCDSDGDRRSGLS